MEMATTGGDVVGSPGVQQLFSTLDETYNRLLSNATADQTENPVHQQSSHPLMVGWRLFVILLFVNIKYQGNVNER